MYRIFLISMMTLLLLGCESRDNDYSYLMTHPKYLEKQSALCEIESSKDDHCVVVRKAAHDFFQLASEQQSDPERFGRKIMDAEVMCMQTKEAMRKAEENYNELKQQKRMQAEILGAQVKYEELKEAHGKEREQVNYMLAVISITPPE